MTWSGYNPAGRELAVKIYDIKLRKNGRAKWLFVVLARWKSSKFRIGMKEFLLRRDIPAGSMNLNSLWRPTERLKEKIQPENGLSLATKPVNLLEKKYFQVPVGNRRIKENKAGFKPVYDVSYCSRFCNCLFNFFFIIIGV